MNKKDQHELWWQGTFEERMERRRKRRNTILNAKCDLRDRITRLKDVWSSLRPKPRRSIADKIRDAGGTVISEPLYLDGE